MIQKISQFNPPSTDSLWSDGSIRDEKGNIKIPGPDYAKSPGIKALKNISKRNTMTKRSAIERCREAISRLRVQASNGNEEATQRILVLNEIIRDLSGCDKSQVQRIVENYGLDN